MAIKKNFLEQLDALTPSDKKAMEMLLASPILWAEATFPPKVAMVNYTDPFGTLKQESQIVEGWLTRPWQQEVNDDPSMKKVIRVGRRCGKAQSLDSTVYTPSGPKLMGELQIGEEVLTPDGARAPIVALHPQGLKDIYALTFSNGEVIEACSEHLWEVTSYTYMPGDGRKGSRRHTHIVDTSWLIDNLPRHQKKKQAISIRATKPVDFDSRSLEVDPYVLGVLLGDGHLNANGAVSFTSIDQEVVEQVEANIGSELALSATANKPAYNIVKAENLTARANHRSYQVNPIRESISKLGLTGSHSWSKFIPHDYLYNSIENRTSLLQGLLDTDSYIGKNGAIYYYTTSLGLSRDVKALVQSLGGTVRTNTKLPTFTYKGIKKNGRPCYVLCLALPNELVPFRLTRKLDRLKSRTIFPPTHYLEKIELVGKKPAQCITIDHPEHLYLTSGFIPTHNSLLASVKALHVSFVRGRGAMVIAPSERHVAEIYETLHAQFMDPHRELFDKHTIAMDKRNPYVIRFKNGGFINFITAGTKSGNEATQVRGQGRGVAFIYMDEADYLSDADIDSIIPITLQDSSIEVWLTSTPTGKRQKFWELCQGHIPGWKAFHKRASEVSPNWSEEKEREYRALYSFDAYKREFDAEFGEEQMGVFNKDRIDEAMQRGNDIFPLPTSTSTHRETNSINAGYGYAERRPPTDSAFRIVGVDWDKYGAGTQIIVIEADKGYLDSNPIRQAAAKFKTTELEKKLETSYDFIKVIHRKEIPKSDLTLNNAVQELLKINRTFQPDFFYLDAGYGEYQIETLQIIGMEAKNPADPNYGLDKKIKRVSFSDGIEVIDPVTRIPEKRRVKPEMVNYLVNRFDSGEMILSPFDIELSNQLINFIVEKITASGEPKYGTDDPQGREHAVDALMLAVWGLYREFGNKIIRASANIGYIQGPLGEHAQKVQELFKKRQNYLSRPNPNKPLDEVERDNIEEELSAAKEGMVRPHQVRNYEGVPESGDTRRDEAERWFKRRGPSSFKRNGGF